VKKTLLSAVLAGLVGLSAYNSSFAGKVAYSLPEPVYKACIKNGVEPALIEAIARVEGIFLNNRPYPYFICVNQPVRVKGLPKLSENCFKCFNESLCRVFALKLVKAGITNFDAGSFQWNYRAWIKRGWTQEDYLNTVFSVEKAGKRACEMVGKFVRKYGYTANAAALYHSATPKFNYRYAVKVYRLYRKIKSEGGER
jgi:hypothetical protein